MSTLNSLDFLASNDIVDEVGGSYKYYCYILANFDPIRAEEIYGSCSVEEVTKAVMARHNFNKPPDAKR